MRLILLTFALLPSIFAAGLQATIQATPNTVGAQSTLSLTLKLDSLVRIDPKGGIRLKTPSNFSSQIQCDIVDPLSVTLVADPITGRKCQLISPNEVQLTIKDGSLPPSSTVFLQFSSFQNPSSTLANNSFSISTFDGSGVTTSSLGGLSIYQLQPGTLASFLTAMTDGIGLVSPQTALMMTFTPAIGFPCSTAIEGCSLTLSLPYLEPNDAAVQHPVIDGSIVRCELLKNQLVSFSLNLLLKMLTNNFYNLGTHSSYLLFGLRPFLGFEDYFEGESDNQHFSTQRSTDNDQSLGLLQPN